MPIITRRIRAISLHELVESLLLSFAGRADAFWALPLAPLPSPSEDLVESRGGERVGCLLFPFSSSVFMVLNAARLTFRTVLFRESLRAVSLFFLSRVQRLPSPFLFTLLEQFCHLSSHRSSGPEFCGLGIVVQYLLVGYGWHLLLFCTVSSVFNANQSGLPWF